MYHLIRLCRRPLLISGSHVESYERVLLRGFSHRTITTSGASSLVHVTLKKSYATGPNTSLCDTAGRLKSTTSNSGLPNQSLGINAVPSEQVDVNVMKLQSWAFSVELFGNLLIRTSLSVRVLPINPHDFPAADRAFIHLMLKSQGDETMRMVDSLRRDEDEEDGLWRRFVRCNVQYNEDTIGVSGDALDDENLSLEDAELLWLIEVPMSYDVNAEVSGNGSITVSQLENQTCNLQTEYGNIVTDKLKSDKVSLRSASGDINCGKVLQGNITIATGNCGTVTTDRLQGQDIAVSADSGTILVNDVYAKTSSFTSTGGDIHLGNVHGDVHISCHQGNVGLMSLDGSLEANVNKGNLSAYLIKHRDVNITCKQGDVSIKTPAEVQTHLHLKASDGIHMAEELAAKFTSKPEETDGPQENTKEGSLNGSEGDSRLTVSVPRGSITLSVQSWLDSLQLNKYGPLQAQTYSRE